MQSISPASTAASKLPLRMWAAISRGSRPQGQAATQVPQRRQACAGPRRVSAGVSARMPFIPLTVGISVERRGWPIIGPPESSSCGSRVRPPQKAIRSAIGVPSGTFRFFGSAIAPPETVRIREISGRPSFTASCTAKAVAMLWTTTPMSAVSARAGVSRPVRVWTRCFSDPIG